jgi:hypothetical protein
MTENTWGIQREITNYLQSRWRMYDYVCFATFVSANSFPTITFMRTRSSQPIYSRKLPSHHTRHILDGMRIAEEARRLVLDLLDLEAVTLVKACGGINDTSHERSLQATRAAPGNVGIIGDGKRIWEREPGRSGGSASSLMDVGCSQGR